MINHVWVTRPKRQLTSVPEVLAVMSEVALGKRWSGNKNLQIQFEQVLERKGLKRSGGIRMQQTSQGGGGARTYYAWLHSLGLLFADNNGIVHLTLAGEALINNAAPVDVLKHQVLRYQHPSSFSMARGVQVSDRFKVHPFIVLLKVLSDSRINTLTEEEIAKTIILEAVNDSDKCVERIIQRIINYRNFGDACLSKEILELFNANSRKLKDVANTMVNWLLYCRLISRDENGSEKGIITISDNAVEEIRAIVNKNWKFIPFPENQELYQRAYGITPWQRKDTRNLTNASTVTAILIKERLIKSAFISESLKHPVIKITDSLIGKIAEKTGQEYSFVEHVLMKNYVHGALGSFMAGYREMAFHGRDECRDFEEATSEIFKEIFGLNSQWLGSAWSGRQVPDVLLVSNRAGYQAIIDTKAYSRYDLPTTQRDRMRHYVREIASYSTSDRPLAFFSYISGGFSATINDPLAEVVNTTRVNGSVITVDNFIKMAEQHINCPYSHEKIKDVFSVNRQILLKDIE